MTNNLLLGGYNITSDPDFLDKQNHITPELRKLLPELHKAALEGNKSSLNRFISLIEKHPKNPQLKNYLSILYANAGDEKKAHETNRWIISEHPDYLFAKINLAFEYFSEGEYEKMPEILGEKMEIKSLYPHRDTFHINEVTSFFKCAIFYYTSINNFDDAQIRLEILQKIAPDSMDTQQSEEYLLFKKFGLNDNTYNNSISVNVTPDKLSQKEEGTVFTHHEIEILYKKDLYIEKEVLSKILELPRKSLIKDLEKVLIDSMERFEYFENKTIEEGWIEENISFASHALFLLGELEATESKETIFQILRQDQDFFEFYFGDFLTEYAWEPFYKILHNDLEACKEFMMEPGRDSTARIEISSISLQIILHQPERKDEVISWFKDLFEFYLQCNLDDNILDAEVIAFMICDVMDFQGDILLPQIEELFSKELVDEGTCGDMEDVKKDFYIRNPLDTKKEILSIYERYEKIISEWIEFDSKFNDSDDDFDYFDEFDNYNDNFEPVLPISSNPKINRNDPCPCGSGKKYKKCCLNS